MFLGKPMAHSSVESHAEGAEEGSPVDCAVVACEYVVGGYDSCGQLNVDRDADMTCQAVAGAGWEYAECSGCAYKAGGYFVDSAVAATCEHAVVSTGGGFGSDLSGVTGARGVPDIDLIAHAREALRQPCIEATFGECARVGIDDECEAALFHCRCKDT